MGRDTDGVSVSSKMKGEGTCLSRRRIREGTIDQEGGLTLIAGNTRGTRAVPARNDRRNETVVIYRLSAVASSRWLADWRRGLGGSARHSCPPRFTIGDVRLAWRRTSSTTDIAGRLIGNEIEQKLLADGLLAQCPRDTCLAIGYA